MVSLDISGQPYLSYDVEFFTERTGNFEACLLEEFLRGLPSRRGSPPACEKNRWKEHPSHHRSGDEAPLARALDQATQVDPRVQDSLHQRSIINDRDHRLWHGQPAKRAEGMRICRAMMPASRRTSRRSGMPPHVILPGVGAAGMPFKTCGSAAFDEAIRAAESGKPFWASAWGMQLLFDRSLENGEHECLGLVPGGGSLRVNGLRVPHMGWNSLQIGITRFSRGEGKAKTYVYFVHSYHAQGWRKGISSPHVNTDIRLQRRCAGGMSLAPSSIPKRAATRELR